MCACPCTDGWAWAAEGRRRRAGPAQHPLSPSERGCWGGGRNGRGRCQAGPPLSQCCLSLALLRVCMPTYASRGGGDQGHLSGEAAAPGGGVGHGELMPKKKKSASKEKKRAEGAPIHAFLSTPLARGRGPPPSPLTTPHLPPTMRRAAAAVMLRSLPRGGPSAASAAEECVFVGWGREGGRRGAVARAWTPSLSRPRRPLALTGPPHLPPHHGPQVHALCPGRRAVRVAAGRCVL